MTGFVQTEFNATCTPVRYPCKPNDRYVDPCDCSSFFLCRDATTIIHQSCGVGTAYDHTSTSAFCGHINDVILGGLCDQHEPWERCVYGHPSADLDELEDRCSGTGHSTLPSPTQPQDDDSNAGTIAAVIVTLLLIVVVVVVVVIYVRKKGNPIKHIKQTTFWTRYIQRERSAHDNSNSQQAVPRYKDTPASATPHDEEIYAEIDDAAVYHDPGSSRPGKSSLKQTTSFGNETYDKQAASFIGQAATLAERKEEVAYDNPALRPAYNPSLTSAKLQHHAGPGGGVEMHRLKSNVHSASVQPSVDEDGYLVASRSSSQAGSVREPFYLELEKDPLDRSVKD